MCLAFLEKVSIVSTTANLTDVVPVNEILSDHNVEKQMTDSRREVAYLMADISNVSGRNLQELYDSLEALSCMLSEIFLCHVLTSCSPHFDTDIALIMETL